MSMDQNQIDALGFSIAISAKTAQEPPVTKHETVLTPIDLADCVPQSAVVVEREGNAVGVMMTYAEQQQFAAAILAKLAEKPQLTTAQPVAEVRNEAWIVGSEVKHQRLVQLVDLPIGTNLYRHPPAPSALLEAANKALEALGSCTNGDYSTGHVVYPSFDEKLVIEAETALRAAIEAHKKGQS